MLLRIILISLIAGAGQSATVTAASLNRQENGVIYFRGTALGLNTPGTANSTNVLFTTSPAAGLAGGGGAAGSSTQSILPYAVGRSGATGNAETLVTYDAINGVRALTTAEFTSTILDGTSTSENARLTTASTLNSATSVNALVLAGGSVSGTGNLNLSSGSFLVASGTPTIANPLSTNSGTGLIEAVITTQGNTILSGNLATAAITKAGTSSLTLGGSLTVAGGASLGGNGLIGRDLNFSASALMDPGNSPGTLTADGDATFAGDAFFRFELNSTTADRLDINGLVTLNGGTWTLRLTDVDGTLPTAPVGYAFLTANSMAGTQPAFVLDYTSGTCLHPDSWHPCPRRHSAPPPPADSKSLRRPVERTLPALL
jgi:hypothetical protein